MFRSTALYNPRQLLMGFGLILLYADNRPHGSRVIRGGNQVLSEPQASHTCTDLDTTAFSVQHAADSCTPNSDQDLEWSGGAYTVIAYRHLTRTCIHYM